MMKRQRLKRFTFLLWGLLSSVMLPAKTVVLPVEAIEESKYLSAQDFEIRYPGIDITDYVLDEEGWYVRYIHESLTYYFGPIYNYPDAQKKETALEEIQQLVIDQRPSLDSSKVDLIRFSFDSGETVVPGDKSQKASVQSTQPNEAKPEKSVEVPQNETDQKKRQESVEDEKSESSSQDTREGEEPVSAEEKKFNIFEFIKRIFSF